MWKKRMLWISLTVLLSLIVVQVTLGLYFYHLVIERGPKNFLKGNEDLEVSADSLAYFLEGDWIDWTKSQPFEQIQIQAFDGIDLTGYYLTAAQETNRLVVFAHGYLGRGSDMGLFGQYYVDNLGYDMFTPDLRGHGQSEGGYIGFGWHDRLDLLDWLDYIVEKKGEDSEIILHGLSMGAAAVLMASGEDLPEQVKGIVADSGYTSVYDLFAYQAKRMYGVPDPLFLPVTSFVTKLLAGYSFQEASAIQQVKKAQVPILYLHGQADTFVPSYMSEQLAKATQSEYRLRSFPDSNHGEAVVLHREAFFDTIEEFLNWVLP